MEGLRAADASTLTAAEVLGRLQSDRECGLSGEEVRMRRGAVGWNEFQISEQEPLWRKYLEQFKNPLIVLLLISALISIVMQQFDDAFSIALAIVIVVTVAFVQEYRSEKSLEALTQLVPHKCHCVRDGLIQEALARELVPGDIVCIGLGDRVPADMRVIEATNLQVDESSFTGETIPSEKTSAAGSAPSKGSAPQQANICYMGTYVVGGHGKAVVVCTGEGSEFGSVFRMMQAMEPPKTPLQKNMDTLGKQLSFYSMCIIGLIMLIGYVQGKPLLSMFTIGVSLAVAAIPEGLPIVVTVTLALGVMRLASRHAIVKKLPIVETLGCVTVVCSDKTGTLTENELTATEVYSTDGQHAVVQRDSVTCNNIPVSASSHPGITSTIEVGCVCNSAQVKGGGAILGHPVDGALLALAGKTNVLALREQYTKEEERPFNSEQKWMAVRVRAAHGQSVEAASCWMMKGALDRVMQHCRPLEPADQEALLNAARTMGSKGLRVIAMARGSALGQLSLEGVVGMVDPPREGVAEAIQYLHRTGVQVKVITGDARETAVNIAQQLGIWDGCCLSGEELEQDHDHDRAASIAKACVLYRVSPKHKVIIVQALQRHGNVVAMTGDGTNDAVALKGAEIGIAMGKSGTDVCREAADMILTDDNFLTIVAAIKEGKGIFYNIKNFVRFQLSTSIAALSLIAVSTVLGLPNPLNAMQILWINIIMDGPPAQSLGVEPVDHHVIMQPPRKTTDAVITKSLLLQTSCSALLILLGTLWVFWTEMTYDNLITPRDTTMTFTCFVLFDMFNAFSCRSQTESSFSLGLFRNKPFLYAVAGSLLGQLLVVYFPPLQLIFLTEALTLWDIVGLVCLASTVLWVDELRKFVMSGRLKQAMNRLRQKHYEFQAHPNVTLHI